MRPGFPCGRPRIALVVASLDIIGGHGVQATALAERLRSEGHEVEIIPVNPRFPSGLRWVRRYPYVRTILNEALYLRSLVRFRRADVVHIFSASYSSFLLGPVPAMLAAKSFRKRAVLNYHSGHAEDHLAHWGALVHPWLALADQIVVPSEYLRRVFARYGYEVKVIRNIVDTSSFSYRKRFPLRPKLLTTRNLEPIYRVDNTLEAFARLKASFSDATLTIAGYGSEEEHLRRLAASLGTEGIRFLGRVEPPAMPAVYDCGDIFVNSSVIDNQPLSVLEAFAAGLPVVSTGTGEIAAMVRDGETGLIVPQDDPAAMAAAVARLLEHPGLALELARRAREEVQRYTWAEVGKEWEAVYCRLPLQPSAPPRVAES